MDTHKNARLTPKGREEMVRAVVNGGQIYAAAARKFNTTPKTVAKWVKRFRAEGVDGLCDRSSRPLSSESQTPQATCDAIEVLRRQRYTGKQIAAEVGVSPATVCRVLKRRGLNKLSATVCRVLKRRGLNKLSATVCRVLKRRGLNKLSALEPAEPIRRYERENPGELIHLDIKKLGRIGSVGHRITGRQAGVVNRHHGIGWEFVHVCIDDASRVAFVQVMADQRKETAVAFLQAAVAYYAKLGVRIARVMTDNGSCYRSKTFRAACSRLGLRQIFTQPYTPKTNGKAERFIQTALREWAYARAYQNSDQRSEELVTWLHRYNWHRPHGSLKANTPISRLALSEDNVLRLHS